MTTERELKQQEEKDVEDFLEKEYGTRSVKQNLITIGVIVAVVIVAFILLG